MPYSSPVDVAFSPDGKTVAFTWLDAIYLGTPLIEGIAAGVMPETCYGQWSSAWTTGFPSGVRVDGGVATPGKSDQDIQGKSYPPMFSPDSRYAAFATYSRIVVVQPRDSGIVLRIEPPAKDEKIVGLTWSAGSELLYATGMPRGARTFWRCDASAPGAQPRQMRHVVFPSAPLPLQEFAGGISWSPSGRWAVLTVQDPPKATSAPKVADIAYHSVLLDLETGKDIDFTSEETLGVVVWKDDTEAICEQYGPGADDTHDHVMRMLHAPSGEFTPLPPKPAEDFRKLSQVMGFDWYTRWSPMPSRPGWLIAADPDDHNIYAVYPKTRTKIKLNDAPTMAYAISADGRKLAHVNAFKKLTVQEIVLPQKP
jgi:hypothetical protein